MSLGDVLKNFLGTSIAESEIVCKKCGKRINGDSAFCSYCGCKLKEDNLLSDIIEQDDTVENEDMDDVSLESLMEKELINPNEKPMKYEKNDWLSIKKRKEKHE